MFPGDGDAADPPQHPGRSGAAGGVAVSGGDDGAASLPAPGAPFPCVLCSGVALSSNLVEVWSASRSVGYEKPREDFIRISLLALAFC